MKIARPQSLTALVVGELRARIVDGRLRLGEHLSENALAAELGISKTPVREALLQLKLERLVDISPQRGTYVFRLGADEVIKVSELREILEVEAAAAAMKRNYRPLVARTSEVLRDMRKAYQAGDNAAYRTIDGELHRTIIELCGNSFISDAYGPIGLRIQALRSRLSDEAALNRLSFRDHCDMVRLIKAGGVARLQRLLRAHIRQTARSYIEVLDRREAAPPSVQATARSPSPRGRSRGRPRDIYGAARPTTEPGTLGPGPGTVL
jgi:DNA-binding GntR family transcriptional regulator